METKEVIIDGIVYVPKESVKDEITTPPFKVGQWVYDINKTFSIRDHVTRITRIDNSGIWAQDHVGESYLSVDRFNEVYRLATPAEIETYLIAEAERRGFKEGVLCSDADDGLVSRLTVIEGYRDTYDSLNFDSYAPDHDFTSTNVYFQGKWAEIIKEPRPLPKTVEELRELLVECVKAYMTDTEEDERVFLDKFMEEFR